MAKSLSSRSDAPAVLLVPDHLWSRDTLSLGLRDRWGLFVSTAVVGCDGEGAEEIDGDLYGGLKSELQDGCKPDPHFVGDGTESSCPATLPRLLFELQYK